MILEALFEYLTYDGDLDSCIEPFVTPISLGGRTIRNRNDARRYLRHLIGDAVYSARIPPSKHSALTLSKISTSTSYHLRGEHNLRSDIVQVDVWTRGDSATVRRDIIGELLRLSLSSFWGNDWSRSNPVHVATVIVQRDSDLSNPEGDADGAFSHRRSIDLDIKYSIPVAEFAPSPSVPAFKVAISGGKVSLVDQTIIARGRTRASVKWSIDGNEWEGAPDVPTAEANTSGIYGDTEFDAAAAGVSGEHTITLTVTDSEGETVTTSQIATI